MNDRSTFDFARKRLVQGIRAIYPGRSGLDSDSSVLNLLSSEQRESFLALSAFDKQHLCRVVRHLEAQGITDRDLLVAGLLHDIGKSNGGAHVRLIDRVAKVLLERFSPGTLATIASDYPNGRFYGLALTVLHPEIGARRARELGCSERTCWLIRHHEETSDFGDPDLACLQAADFAS